jgi:hypothetical protein
MKNVIATKALNHYLVLSSFTTYYRWHVADGLRKTRMTRQTIRHHSAIDHQIHRLRATGTVDGHAQSRMPPFLIHDLLPGL